MTRARHGSDIEAIAHRLQAEAVRMHGVPDDAALRAAAATVRKFACLPDAPGHGRDRRATAYFWGVLRRQALRGGPGSTAFRERYLLAALAQDLAAAGHGPHTVFEQLVSRFGDSVGVEILERYRPLQPV